MAYLPNKELELYPYRRWGIEGSDALTSAQMPSHSWCAEGLVEDGQSGRRETGRGLGVLHTRGVEAGAGQSRRMRKECGFNRQKGESAGLGGGWRLRQR